MSSPEGSTVMFRRTSGDVRPRAILRFARKLQRELAKDRPFDTLITGEAELRSYNREFRGKDYPTDVLSFPCGAGLPPAPERSARPALLGDIAISIARARAQAR